MNGRFAAVKVIEGDQDIIRQLKLSENELEMMEHSIIEMETDRGLDRNAAMADMRYSFIENICEYTYKPISGIAGICGNYGIYFLDDIWAVRVIFM